MNKFVGMGRFTRDPETKTTPNGVVVTTFTLAVDRKYKSQDGEKIADFIPCVAWRGTAETIGKHFRKGDGIIVVGSVQTRNWEDDKGNKRISTEVVLDEFYFLPKSKKNSEDVPAADTMGFAQQSEEDDGSLPFDL